VVYDLFILERGFAENLHSVCQASPVMEWNKPFDSRQTKLNRPVLRDTKSRLAVQEKRGSNKSWPNHYS
jgi:hypothetical protein